MRDFGKLHCVRDILSPFLLFPEDYFCRRYCVFEEDAIMTQQTTPRLKSIVATTTICVILAILCCNLPQADSLGSECYTITGLDYRGTQDQIGLPPDAGVPLKFTECLPWNTSVESTKPRARERGIGKHNYCRNPDGDILPWCKTAGFQGSDGAWGYCHLPTCKVPGYVGCFPNQGSPSALDGIDILYKEMTVGACIDFCRRNGFKYAGLEAGHACSCGDGEYNRYGPSADRGTHCASKCFGNKGQPCGGDGFVDIYRSDIGSCRSDSPLRAPSGAVYSPGYPDYPGNQAMMTSQRATESMMKKHTSRKNKHQEPEPGKTMVEAKELEKKCEWTIDIKKASEIKLLFRKIDPKRKLGGVILISAGVDASIVVKTSSKSNVTTQTVWITESAGSKHDVDVMIPGDEADDRNIIADISAKQKPLWSTEVNKRRWPRYTLRSRSLESKVSIKGEAFTVRFMRDDELIVSLKTAHEFPRSRSNSRRKHTGVEWSRFVVEYEASFPEGITYTPYSDAKNDVTSYAKKSGDGRRNKEQKSKSENTQENNDVARKTLTADALANTKFSISQKDALAIKHAVSSASAGLGRDTSKGEGSNSPIKIEVFVEPVDSSSEKSTTANPPMSEFMIPLLLAVLLTTTAILILSAVLIFVRRGGRTSHKKNKEPHYSPGNVVACPRDGDREKSGSTSDLSSSSTADSVLLMDSESSRYSPKLARRSPPSVSPETIKDLMEFLKNQPGIIQSHPLLEANQYKQISQNPHFFAMGGNLRHDDVTPLPGPCAHCCGCPDDNRAHRHGDSCRAHHNQGKHGRPQISSSSRPSGGKNPRGLSIRTNKPGTGAQPSLAPPLSPISEVSSVTSSMMSLPITSANSQTSLLKQTPKSSLHKVSKKDPAQMLPESEAFLASESDAESGISEPSRVTNSKCLPGTSIGGSKLRFSDKISEQTIPGRYLGGIAGACYDSGYATSNYEEEEDKARYEVLSKENNKTSAPNGVTETNYLTEP